MNVFRRFFDDFRRLREATEANSRAVEGLPSTLAAIRADLDSLNRRVSALEARKARTKREA